MTPGRVSASFVLGTIPNDGNQYVSYTTRVQTSPITGISATQPSADSGGSFQEVHIGKYIYTFGTRLPATADPTATHSIGIYARRDLEADFEIPNQVANEVVHFRPDGGEVTKFRDVVATVSCNQCHDPLQMHGGRRRETELCVMCHTVGVIDPDTENSVDFKEMVHKIHRGADLPSVQDGTPYIIIGFRQSVHDYSDVHFPRDIRACDTCHNDNTSQQFAFALRPARQPCGACHDDVDFVTGEGHPGGPQADDSQCAVCHRPVGDNEFDASVIGAHTIESESTQLEGINLEFLEVTNSGPGQSPTVRFTLSNDAGDTIMPSSLGRFRLRIAGPTTGYTFLLTEDAGDAVVPMGGTEFAYTFAGALPADAQGSFAISLEARRDVILDPGGKEISHREQIDPPVFYFPVTDLEAVPRRTIIADANCEECHRDLSMHGDNRRNVEHCVFCHAPGASDVRRRPEEDLPAEAIDFKYMIHRLHRGHELSRDFTIYGFGNRAINFNELRFPGDLRNCSKCHEGDSYFPPAGGILPTITEREFFSPMPPTTTACLACHETIEAAAHAFVNIAPFAESCSICHGEGAAFSVEKVHVR